MKKILLIGGAVAALTAGAALAHGGKGGFGRHHGGYHHGHHGDYGHRKGRHHRRGERIEKRFGELDADGDGLVTKAEMDAAKANRFKAMDSNGDGAVDARELVEYRMLRRAERRIARLDKNEDGKLQADELPDRKSLTRFDLNNDGAVSRAEIDLAMKYRGGRHGRDGKPGDRKGGDDAPAPKKPKE